MFGSISRLIFGDYQVSEEVTAPGSLAAVNEDLDFDTRSEDGEWVLITRDEPPAAVAAAVTLSISEVIESPPMDQITSQPVVIAMVARTPKKSKKKKAAQELGKSLSSGEKKGNLASKILPGALAHDRHLSAKTTESKAFRCSKKSLERNNKVVMVASCQRKPRMCDINFRYNSRKGTTH